VVELAANAGADLCHVLRRAEPIEMALDDVVGRAGLQVFHGGLVPQRTGDDDHRGSGTELLSDPQCVPRPELGE